MAKTRTREIEKACVIAYEKLHIWSNKNGMFGLRNTSPDVAMPPLFTYQYAKKNPNVSSVSVSVCVSIMV